jgi:hypothetical protein
VRYGIWYAKYSQNRCNCALVGIAASCFADNIYRAVFSELSEFGKTAVSHDLPKAIMYENGSTEVVPVATMARDEI